MMLIIDGDVLAYQACKPRYLKKAHIDYENQVSYVLLNEDGSKKDFEFTEKEDREYLEESWENFNSLLADLLEANYADDYLMAVKGNDNFRYLLYPEYKMNRHADPTKMNKFVPILRKMAVDFELAVPSYGMEADDLLRMWSEEAKQAGQEYIICSIDKDLLCIPGKHYLMHKKEILDVSEEDAMRNYYQQLLKGDPTDNIPGVPKVGDVKAKKIIASCSNEEEMQEAVVSNYIAAYGDDWLNYFLSNAKMIHLFKKKDDFFSVKDWKIVKELI